MYTDKLDNGGTVLNSFLESFIATFIFMESSDNLESLVYNNVIYEVSKAGAILLLFIAIFGTFFLVTLATLRVRYVYVSLDAFVVAADKYDPGFIRSHLWLSRVKYRICAAFV